MTTSNLNDSSFYLEEDQAFGARIKIIGVGGGGGNAVNTMMKSNFTGVDFIVANTDKQDLNRSLAPAKVQLGRVTTKGLGAGGDPEVGKVAALEDEDAIKGYIKGADMVFITAGMGGGTGTGAAPIIAKIARDAGILTIAVVTKPFLFEGLKRKQKAEEGLEDIRKYVDTLITIPNERLKNIMSKDISGPECFKMVDEVLLQSVRGISDLVNKTGYINLDFADIKATMKNSRGVAMVGIGSGSGDNMAKKAANSAMSSHLLGSMNINGASGLILNITSGSKVPLDEIISTAEFVKSAAGENANVMFGWVIDDEIGNEIRLTIVATGISGETIDQPQAQKITKPEVQPGKSLLRTKTHNTSVDTSTANLFETLPADADDDTPAWVRKHGKTLAINPEDQD
jgi:cell division protein FtsZ